MKIFRFRFALLLPLAALVHAQDATISYAADGGIVAAAPSIAAPPFDASQLDQLLGSIALYPDALVALILPAATNSSDIVLAARYFQGGGDPNLVDAQPWDDSVRALAHYPDIVRWMDQNLAWTKQLGDAFLAQPAEVMNGIQRLRAEARAAGTLVDTPQQQILATNDEIAIVPTQPDVIYVPYYDPALAYARPSYYYSSSIFTFGPPLGVGAWLSYNLDWHRHSVWVVNRGDRERFWREHRDDWRRPVPPNAPGYVNSPVHHPWAPHFNHPPRPTNAPQNYAPQIFNRGSRPETARSPTPAATTERPEWTHNRSVAPSSTLPLRNPLPQPLPNPISAQLANPAAPTPPPNYSPRHQHERNEPRPAPAGAPAAPQSTPRAPANNSPAATPAPASPNPSPAPADDVTQRERLMHMR
ncbi:MAG TPA: DUF3300 domain-containing protein [Opitutaceae bacterium]|nr:DUF3300 domain-containing protein [Opitutaceae bacterium]